MADFSNITDVNALLKESQDAEYDRRATVREVIHFLEKTDGQWEPGIIESMSGRPRYTFDKCNPVVDAISGEMEQAEFAIKARPGGGEASQDTAKLYDGLIRNIQSISNAEHIFDAAGRKMVQSGFDAWRVVQDWADADSFEQDLFIRKIANSIDRVWFDTGAEMQDMSDANHAFVLQALTKAEYEERFPEGSGQSVGESRLEDVYYYKADLIMVGEFLYKEMVDKELVLMSNNAVYEDDEKFQSIQDELAADGITEVRRRKRKSPIVHSRFFDGSDWLSEPKKTVFSYIPVIPTYGNFAISENKVIYRGAIEKLMDAQRVFNYSESRKIEEGALAPRGKYWMTNEQAQAHLSTLRTMNTNANPIQQYTHVEGQPPPFWQGGAQINPGLSEVSQSANQNIIEGSGIFAANQGNAGDQSGIAIELQQNKGDNSTFKYFRSQEIAIMHTGRILADAIPKVYDTKRQVRILGEDGISKMEMINDSIYDEQTQQNVEVNDLRKGKYDITMDIGPAFKNRQQETARAFAEIAGIDPTIIQQGGDVWLANLQAPGMELMAERKRKQLFEAGMIPDSQMTDEEKETAQAMIDAANANPPQPSPMDIAVMEQTQANTANVMSMAMERQNKAVLAQEKQDLEDAKFAANLDQQQIENFMEAQKAAVKELVDQVSALKTLRESMGVDTIVGPTNTQAYKQQSEIVLDTQETQQ